MAVRLTGAISPCISPPLRHIRPLGIALCWWLPTFLRISFNKSPRGMTARLTMKSYLVLFSSTLQWANVTFCNPIACAISCATLIFFPMRSMRWNRHSGKSMARGMPGNPPPVPTSRSVVSGVNCITLAIPRECNT